MEVERREIGPIQIASRDRRVAPAASIYIELKAGSFHFFINAIPEMAEKQLSAKYQSPTSSESFSIKLPSLSTDHDVKAKTEYLSTLRSGIVQIQSDVNAFLTQKMEEEKSSDATKDGSKAKEEKAEELYGEEDPEAEG